jgi:hypothetical protein
MNIKFELDNIVKIADLDPSDKQLGFNENDIGKVIGIRSFKHEYIMVNLVEVKVERQDDVDLVRWFYEDQLRHVKSDGNKIT